MKAVEQIAQTRRKLALLEAKILTSEEENIIVDFFKNSKEKIVDEAVKMFKEFFSTLNKKIQQKWKDAIQYLIRRFKTTNESNDNIIISTIKGILNTVSFLSKVLSWIISVILRAAIVIAGVLLPIAIGILKFLATLDVTALLASILIAGIFAKIIYELAFKISEVTDSLSGRDPDYAPEIVKFK